MENKTGVLGYNYDNDRMGILDRMDLWADDGLQQTSSLRVSTCRQGSALWPSTLPTESS